MLDINPPEIRIRDFGSLHGTYVNGKIIGKRQREQTPEEGARINFPEYNLKEGDEIGLHNTVLRVSIEGTTEKPVRQFASVGMVVDKTASLLIPKGWQSSPTVCTTHVAEVNLPTLGGYTTLKRLGKGEWGEVYLAHRDQTGELVALKVIGSPRNADREAIEKFLRQVCLTKALQHRNIVELKEFRYNEGNLFFILEYCNGGSVADLMRQRDGRLSVNEAMSITLQVLDGLAYGHNFLPPQVIGTEESLNQIRGLVHRDLKPTNILLANARLGRIAKVANYGLGKAFALAGLSSSSLRGSYASTPAFMPRQQAIHFNYAEPEVDVWAMAACLYYMLTAKFPRDLAAANSLSAVLQTQPVPIRERDASIPRRLAQVIDLALVDNPNIYFKNAGAFKQALESVFC